jgi:hypothetical protein
MLISLEDFFLGLLISQAIALGIALVFDVSSQDDEPLEG